MTDLIDQNNPSQQNAENHQLSDGSIKNSKVPEDVQRRNIAKQDPGENEAAMNKLELDLNQNDGSPTKKLNHDNSAEIQEAKQDNENQPELTFRNESDNSNNTPEKNLNSSPKPKKIHKGQTLQPKSSNKKASKFVRFRVVGEKVNHKKSDHKPEDEQPKNNDQNNQTQQFNKINRAFTIGYNNEFTQDFTKEHPKDLQKPIEPIEERISLSSDGYDESLEYSKSPEPKKISYKITTTKTEKFTDYGENVDNLENYNEKDDNLNIVINQEYIYKTNEGNILKAERFASQSDEQMEEKIHSKKIIDKNNNNYLQVTKQVVVSRNKIGSMNKIGSNLATNYEEEMQDDLFNTVTRPYDNNEFEGNYEIENNPLINMQQEIISDRQNDSLASKSMILQVENDFYREELKEINPLYDSNAVGRVSDPNYRRNCLSFLDTKNNTDELSQEDFLECTRIVEVAENCMSDLVNALYYIKCIGRAGKITKLRDWLYDNLSKSDFLNNITKILELFEYKRIIVVNTLCSLSYVCYQNNKFADEVLDCKFWPRLKQQQETEYDENSIKYFALLVTNMTYRNDFIKRNLCDLGHANILLKHFKIAVQNNMVSCLHFILSALANLITIKDVCRQIFIEQNFYIDFVDYVKRFSNHKEIVVCSQIVIRNLIKNCFNKEIQTILNKGQLEFFEEIFTDWKEDSEITRQLLFTLGEFGAFDILWNHLERVNLSWFINDNLDHYDTNLTKSALTCQWYLTKISSVADSIVITDRVEPLHKAFFKHNDSSVVSLILLIYSNLVWSKKIQDHLSSQKFYKNLRDYYYRVIQTKIDDPKGNESLILVYANIAQKLTNCSETCQFISSKMHNEIFELVAKYFDTYLFDKIYNLQINVGLGDLQNQKYLQNIIEVSIEKEKQDHSVMFKVNFSHFLERALNSCSFLLQQCQKKYKDSILEMLDKLPQIAKYKVPIIKNLINKTNPQTEKQLGELWNRSKVEMNMIQEVTKGIRIARFRPSGKVEHGTLICTNDKLDLIFVRDDWVSFSPIEDCLTIDGFVKMVKGFDKKSNAYYKAMAKANQKIDESCCQTIYSKKTAKGESGFYMGFWSKEKREEWYSTLQTMNKENVQRLADLKKQSKK